jgi:ribose transport system permease protein
MAGTAGGYRGGGPWMARWRRSAGIWVATGLLFAVSAIFQPKSLGGSALAALWPFAAVLILAAAGQTLVVQQRGIDLSVPGFISLTVVLVTHIPDGTRRSSARRSCSPTRSAWRREWSTGCW